MTPANRFLISWLLAPLVFLLVVLLVSFAHAASTALNVSIHVVHPVITWDSGGAWDAGGVWDPVQGGSCTPGNHGPVRGRPKIVTRVFSGTGTTAVPAVVAEDGCLIRGLHTVNFCCNDTTTWQAYHDVGHFNAVRYLAIPPAVGEAWNSGNIGDELIALDQMVAAASATGMYLVIDQDNAQTTNACDINVDSFFWQQVAPRYATNTNVIYEVSNECDFYPTTPSGVGTYNATLYNVIHPLAPNTMAWLFTPTSFTDAYPQQYIPQAAAVNPPVSWTNAAFAMHIYGGYQDSARVIAQNAGVAVEHDEQCFAGVCGGTDPLTLENFLPPVGVGWFLLDGVGFCTATTCYGDPTSAHQPSQYIAVNPTWPVD